jgi:hypothetical protein
MITRLFPSLLLGHALLAFATQAMQRTSEFNNLTGPQVDQRYQYGGTADSFTTIAAAGNGIVNMGHFS